MVRTRSISGLMNFYLLLMITHVIIGLILLHCNHVFILQKIFKNQQMLRDLSRRSEVALIQQCDLTKSSERLLLGFFPDDLQIYSNSGYNVYYKYLRNEHRAVGCRTFRVIEPSRLSQQIDYYAKLFSRKKLIFSKLKIISLSGLDLPERLFFLNDAFELWGSDPSLNQLYLVYSDPNEKVINYIVTRNLQNYYTSIDHGLVYTIYLHIRKFDPNTATSNDLIKIIHRNQFDYSTTNSLVYEEFLNDNNYILDFFVRGEYLIIVYLDPTIKPKIYKIEKLENLGLENNFNFTCKFKQIDVVLEATTSLSHQDLLVPTPKVTLIWNGLSNKHVLSILKGDQHINYLFNLPNDYCLLGSRNEF